MCSVIVTRRFSYCLLERRKKAKRVLDTDHLLLLRRHFATRSPLAVAARNTFPRKLQTNFESFPNSCCTSRDCRLTGYFIINM
jgi:hypothetical protein